MGDVADDAYAAAEREEDLRWVLMNACDCKNPTWKRDQDGLLECQSCGTVVDE